MAKPLRLYSPTGWYHVFNRGARRRGIFGDREDRLNFLEQIARVVEPGIIECHAFCLMGNHYHLVLRAEDRLISNAMHAIGSGYVRNFNDRYGYDGPMFRSRFGSTAIDDTDQLLHTIRYVHRNPVDLWEDIRTYEWSSHRAYLGDAPVPRWLSTSAVLAEFGHDRRTYGHFVDEWPILPEAA